MKKTTVLKQFEGATDLARQLGYAHRNVYYRWPVVLTVRIIEQIIMRMKSARIPVPAEWRIKNNGSAH